MITADTWEYLRWWRDWKRYDSLPYPGGLLDQPAYITQAIRTCENTFLEVQEDNRIAAERKLEQARKPKR